MNLTDRQRELLAIAAETEIETGIDAGDADPAYLREMLDALETLTGRAYEGLEDDITQLEN